MKKSLDDMNPIPAQRSRSSSFSQAKGTDLTPLLIAPEVLHSRPKALRAGTKFQILMDKLDGSLPKKDL